MLFRTFLSFLRVFKVPRPSQQGPDSTEPPVRLQRPLDLLDRCFRLPNEGEVKVVGYQKTGKFFAIPYLVRCRSVGSAELLLVDPDFIRAHGEDVTPPDCRIEASRKPYEVVGEEVARIVGGGLRPQLMKEAPGQPEFSKGLGDRKGGKT